MVGAFAFYGMIEFFYPAQLLELDIMQHPKEVKTLMSSINTLERYARKYTPKDSG